MPVPHSKVSTRRHLFLKVLMALSIFASFVQFSLVFDHETQSSFEKQPIPECGSGTISYLSLLHCHQRREEFKQQLIVEAKIYDGMLGKARERAKGNEYLRQRPIQLEKQHAEYYKEVQHAISKSRQINPQYAVWKNFSHHSFADLSILGFPKAGTSQLYKLLSSHPNTEPVFKRKEYCVDHNHFLDYTMPHNQDNETLYHLQKKLWVYHKHVLHKRTIAPPSQMLVNACLQTVELDYHLAYAALPESSKFMLLFRDPADWLWASWNFWIDKNMDQPKPLDHDWASPGVHYRSPELFHELILSQGALKSAGKRFRTMREQTVHVPRRLLYLVGRNRVLFIKSEDMKASNNNHNMDTFLGRLSNFTGLSQDKFDQNVAHGQTNCNAHKGFQNLCHSSSSSAYEITHYRPMLQATRQFIYIQFHEECKVWAEEFGIIYRDCLQALRTK